KWPPASSGRRSAQQFETRISAIADFARKGKQEKKALPLSPAAAVLATHAREPQRVAEDVLRPDHPAERARRNYGVVVEAERRVDGRRPSEIAMVARRVARRRDECDAWLGCINFDLDQ